MALCSGSGLRCTGWTGEEFSAFGVSKEDSGVQLVEVPAGSAAAEAGLQANDLIQGINGTKVPHTDALFSALIAAGEASLKLRIIRNQQPLELTLAEASVIITETADAADGFSKLVPPTTPAGRVTANQATRNDPLATLTDGRLAAGYGPVFGNGIRNGAYKLDLGAAGEVAAATAWSFARDGQRGRQKVTVFGSPSAADPGWQTADSAIHRAWQHRHRHDRRFPVHRGIPACPARPVTRQVPVDRLAGRADQSHDGKHQFPGACGGGAAGDRAASCRTVMIKSAPRKSNMNHVRTKALPKMSDGRARVFRTGAGFIRKGGSHRLRIATD